MVTFKKNKKDTSIIVTFKKQGENVSRSWNIFDAIHHLFKQNQLETMHQLIIV